MKFHNDFLGFPLVKFIFRTTIMKTQFIRFVIVFLVGVIILAPFSIARANKYGYWTVNGVGLGASLEHTFTDPLYLTIKGRSYAQPPTGVLSIIFVSAEATDRCSASQPWQTYALASKSVNSSNNTGYAQDIGQYQNCSSGHQYRDNGVHFYYWPSVGLNHYKYLTDNH
ncbi:MAG: hypothetical protein Fur0022_48070 [Anaerolineales bacterium]